MPVYEYVCTSCGKEFEQLARSMTERNQARCPKCDGRGQRRLSVFAARSGAAKSKEFSSGCCGQCGDPNGPCSN